MRCERCRRRPAVVVVVDEPEVLWDEVLGWLLCDPCLRVTEADGPWHQVYAMEEAA